MKKLFFLLPLLCFSSFISCKAGNGSSSEIIDYSNNPYVGFGSHYMITAGSGDSYKTMHFFFDPDGVGAWGGTKIVNGKTVSEVHEYIYTITGDVNVAFIEKESKEKGKGYFTTNQTGQCFVIDGVYFYRYD